MLLLVRNKDKTYENDYHGLGDIVNNLNHIIERYAFGRTIRI